MPDTIEPPDPGQYPPSMEARVAVLEQIARATATTLERIERRLDAVETNQRADFRWLLGIMLSGFAPMLRGFGAPLAALAPASHRLSAAGAQRVPGRLFFTHAGHFGRVE